MTAITADQITRNNTRIARAAGMALGADGLVLAQVVRPHLTCALILLGTFVALTLAKAVMIALMGAEGYGASLVLIQDGGLVDRAGAMLMGVDGATRAIADLMM